MTVPATASVPRLDARFGRVGVRFDEEHTVTDADPLPAATLLQRSPVRGGARELIGTALIGPGRPPP